MNYLIDTHTFLWFINDDPKLSKNAETLIESDVDIYVSIASLWEIAIKTNLKKLTLSESYDKFIPKQLALNDFELLSIELSHLNLITTLTQYHRDPFDRLLIAQAIVENMVLISVDSIFDRYGVNRIW
ncbi:MAG: type II toxin-antitoxin system VapC family toxin [Spirulina sp.]